MKIFIILFTLLSACTAKEIKIAEDVIEGEVKTGEKVLEDLSVTSSSERMPPIYSFNF